MKHDDVVKVMKEWIYNFQGTAKQFCALCDAITLLEENAALIERQTGRWAYRAPIRRGQAPVSDLLKCSVCDGVVERIDGVNYRYCPNCGAKMEG